MLLTATDNSFNRLTKILWTVAVCWAILSSAGWAQKIPSGGKGLAANSMPTGYNAAQEYFADGQTTRAAKELENALSQSQMVNAQRDIESLPAMVRLGECLLTQCDLSMALEQYDSALQIFLDSPQWFSKPLGSTSALRNATAGQSPTGRVFSIDTLEILRCQAIALRRRYQLLGPLAKHDPKADRLLNAFNLKVAGQSESIQSAMNVCGAIALIGTGEQVTSAQRLKQNLVLADGSAHPLTAIALLTLADLAIEANDILAAEERAVEASTVAGRAGQMDHLTEAVEYLSETGFANGHTAETRQRIQQLSQGANTKSRMVVIRCQVELAKLSSLVGDVDKASQQCSTLNTRLQESEIVMPRAESVIRYVQSRIEFLKGNVQEGSDKLDDCLAYLRGEGSRIGSPRLFQLVFALHLTNTKAIPDPVAEVILEQLLRSPTEGNWRAHFLEQLDWLMFDKTDANNALLDIQLRTRSDSELVAAMDDSVRKRYRRMNELESRVFDLQTLFHGDGRFVCNPAHASQLRKQLPIESQNVGKLQQLLAPYQTNPKRHFLNWSADDSRRWESIQKLSVSQESLLWAAAITPLNIAETFPPSHSQSLLDQTLRPSDAVVLFAAHGTTMRGFLYQSAKWCSWDVQDFEGLESKNADLLDELMAMKNCSENANGPKMNWGLAKRIAIRNQLFPTAVWQQLIAAERWIVVPDAGLWYLPLDALPLSDEPNSLPCISDHCITYSPTLGLVPYLLDAKPNHNSDRGIDVHVSDFLSHDKHSERDLRDDLAAQKRQVIDLTANSSANPPSHFFKIASDSIHTYAPMSWETIAPVSTDLNSNQSYIRSWSLLPWGSPSSMILAGVDAVSSPSTAKLDEWLRMTLPLIAQGTRQLTISRWPVGGESTVSLIRSFQDNQEDLSVSESWQRSVLTLWEENFEQQREPVFARVPGANEESTVSGSNPLLWSGYIRIGDSK